MLPRVVDVIRVVKQARGADDKDICTGGHQFVVGGLITGAGKDGNRDNAPPLPQP
jgi:hypothetical protein